ncbi:hypothetical protein HMPREF3201_02448 [Megasphaera sp. MJR8396C]|nr:hypothetical protein HMPREF3201_02448 [Megasphaera sp. MJR8396C]
MIGKGYPSSWTDCRNLTNIVSFVRKYSVFELPSLYYTDPNSYRFLKKY